MSIQTTFGDPAIGQAGLKQGLNEATVVRMRNDESSAAMPFGIAVKNNSTSDAQSAKLLTAVTAEHVAGITMHSHAHLADDLNDDGEVKAGKALNVMRHGLIMVECENGCNVGSPLFIRCVTAGAEQAGALRSASDSTDCIDASAYGTWESSAAAGGLALLRFDFRTMPTPS